MDINKSFQTAFRHFQSGNTAEAERLCGQILKKQPKNIDALHLLGLIFFRLENYDQAIKQISRVVALNPHDADAYFNLGNVFFGKKQFDDAIANYKKAIQYNPNIIEAYDNLGNAHIEKKQLEEAIACYQEVIQINPHYAAAYNNLGIALQENRQLDEAIPYFQKALSLKPDYVDANYNLGIAFQEKKRLDDAITSFQKALQIDPYLFDAYFHLGNIFQSKGQVDDAIACYQKAIQINPNFPEAHKNLGIVFREKGQLDNAVICYQKALQLNPYFAAAYYNFGNTLQEQGITDKAFAAYDAALFFKPDFIEVRWARCMAHLRKIYPDQESINLSRKHYHEALMQLRETVLHEISKNIDATAGAVGSLQPFNLAYQNINDRELQQLYGDLICRIMASKFPQFANRPAILALSSEEPLRVGIASGFFHYHSNWKIPLKGWIENLDKKRFRLHGYYTRRVKDKETDIARQHFFRFVEDIYSFEELCKIIREDNLHVLIYPEIGMDPMTVRLASLRLAPLQCTSWGHCDTSGLPTIDYYLSSDLMEPPDAVEHYSEYLIRLPNLSIYYTPVDIQPAGITRDTYSLRQKSILYLCSHTLPTHLPQYDDIYPRIAQQVGDCQFLFISYNRSNTITEQFRQRISTTFGKFNLNYEDYAVFLPFLDAQHYIAVNCLADISLDTIGWSGCNSSFEAIQCNLPIVTLPGSLMRGRHCTAILTMMGMTELIAESVDHYIETAVKLGQDGEWRRYISDKISENKHRIYRDRACIIALEDFLEGEVRKRCTSAA
jgi:protein O-GlcNAc transferase